MTRNDMRERLTPCSKPPWATPTPPTCTDRVPVSTAASPGPGFELPGVFCCVLPGGGVVFPVFGVVKRLVMSTGSRVSGRDANWASSSVVGALMMMGGLSMSCTPSVRMSAQSGPDSSAGTVSQLSCGGIGWVYGWAWARGTAALEVWSDVLGVASSSVGFGV